MKSFLPKPGQGPTENSRKSGFFKFRFYVFGNKFKALVSVNGIGWDPGYGSTSKMLAESSSLFSLRRNTKSKWCIDPINRFRNALLDRLEKNADLKFKIKYL